MVNLVVLVPDIVAAILGNISSRHSTPSTLRLTRLVGEAAVTRIHNGPAIGSLPVGGFL